ncbi:MAG: hypothetical protein C0417_11110 [Chlorobiaceae bacterium]|nr:hypothetical protein [Chlorobiaceae bacterium]
MNKNRTSYNTEKARHSLFMIEYYCVRSTVLLTENLSIYSSQNCCVLFGNVMRKRHTEKGES